MNTYDNKNIFDSFLKEREDPNSPFNLQVRPIMLSYMGNLCDKTILDLGCGMGHFAYELSNSGAKSVLGIDISKKEIDYAIAKHSLPNVKYQVLDAQNIKSLNQKFDIVSSGIVIDYIEDIDSLFNSISKCLTNDGIFVFSQVHPLSTAPKQKRTWLSDENCDFIYQLSDYSFEGKREMSYFGGKVVMYHRTFSTLISTILKNGFEILEINEPIPSAKEIEKYPNRLKNLHKPSFLVFKLKKKN